MSQDLDLFAVFEEEAVARDYKKLKHIDIVQVHVYPDIHCRESICRPVTCEYVLRSSDQDMGVITEYIKSRRGITQSHGGCLATTLPNCG